MSETPIAQNSGWTAIHICERYGLKTIEELQKALDQSPVTREYRHRQLINNYQVAKQALEDFNRKV